jgi:hypothetical protein
MVNFEIVVEKLKKMRRYWSRFNLSLPGRISVAKTFMLQQINHIGCTLMPDETLLNRIQDIIDSYCVSSLQVANDRLYLDPQNGGLGLFSIKEFLISQQVNWIKRTGISTWDNWRVKICNATFGNCFMLSENSFNKNLNPVLFSLSCSWSHFLSRFYRLDNNYKESYIFNNPLITRSSTDKKLLDENFLEKLSFW